MRLAFQALRTTICTAVALSFGGASAQTAQTALSATPALRGEVLLEAALAARKTASATSPHIDSLLLGLQLDREQRAGLRAQTASTSSSGLTAGGTQVRDGRVLVQAYPRRSGNDLAAQLKTLGATGVQNHGSLVTGWVSVEALSGLAGLSTALSVRAIPEPARAAGSVTSQGDGAQRSPLARLAFGDGKLAKVGIISDSFNALGGLALGVSTGNLPGPGNPNGFNRPVQILKDRPSGAGTDEGRAMGEIIHDVAPGAALSFYGPDSYLDLAQGVRQLAQNGATVVVDDLTFFGEPWYQASPIGKAASDVGRQSGTTVISSAGNESRLAIEASFRPGPLSTVLGDGQSIGNYRLHRFPNGQSTTPITLRGGGFTSFVLQWDEPFASASPAGVGARSDLALFLFAESQGVNAFFVSDVDNVGADAVEFIAQLQLNNPDPNAGVTVYLGVGQFEGSPATPRNIKVLAFERGTPSFFDRTVFNTSTILGHPNEASIIASCAVRYNQVGNGFNAVPEAFSSVGGFRKTISASGSSTAPLNTRKPDFCSPQGANTSFFFPRVDLESDGFPNFLGTSASAPHLAGIVALMQNSVGGVHRLPPAAVKASLLQAARDMDNPETAGVDTGYDVKTGNGFIDAFDAVVRAQINRAR